MSTITELSEDSCVSNSTFRFKSFGVCQKNTFLQAKKTEAKVNENKKTKSPAITDEENSVSCLFIATIGSADESVINDTLERLPRNRNPENIIEDLIQEALNAKNVGADENNANLQDNVPDKPVLKEITNEVSNKRKSCTVISNSTSEEIEGTQFSTIYHKRNIKDKFVMKETEIIPIKVSNDKVEEFFSQHFSNNPVAEEINPSLAKKHNETESESSEENPQIITENVNMIESDIDLNVENCLKYIIDTICTEFEKCNNLHDTSNVIKDSIQENLEEHNENTKDGDFKSPAVKVAKTIKLKFKNTKKVNAKKNQKKTKVKNETSSIAQKVETAKDTNFSSVSVSNTNVEENNKKTKRTLRNKRKLYSPKDEVFDDKSDQNDDIRNITTNLKTYKTRALSSYKEIEKERNEYRKKLRTKQPKETREVFLSPKTQKMNVIFDTLKSNIDTNQNITLVNKSNTSKNANVYNFSSDSEDDNFKTTKMKKLSPKRSALEKKSNQNNKKKTYSRKNAKPKLTIKKEIPLIDERMREALQEVLDTSFEFRRSPRNITKEPEPNINTEHEMDVIEEGKSKYNTSSGKAKIKLEKNKKSPLKNKRTNINKITNYIKSKEMLDTTLSPLPGLTVETIPNKNVANVSASPKRLEKIKEMYVDSPGRFENTNTTQNLLKDLDQTSDCGFQVMEHFAEIHHNSQDSQSSRILRSRNKQSPTKKVTVVKKSIKKNNKKNKRRDEIDPTRYVIDISADSNSEKSINTVGICPITAHGDFELCCNDLPPDRDILNKTIEPRNLGLEDENESIKDLYLQLQNEVIDDQMNSPRKSYRNTIESVSKKSPSKVMKTISDDYIRYLPSPRDSESSSNHTVDELLVKRTTVSNKSDKKSTRISNNLNKNTSRKSQISPIRLFHEEPTKRKSQSNSIESDGVKKIRNLFYKSKSNKDTKSTANKTSQNSESSKRESSRDSINRIVKRKPSELVETNKKRKIESVKSNSPVQSSTNVSYSNINNWIESLPSTSTGK